MGYLVQLLLKDAETARILREALVAYEHQDISEHKRDLTWALLTDLTDKMRRAERTAGRT